MMALEKAAESYFSSMNSMARRMYDDMKETKLAYEDLWDTFSEKEKKEILSESIITPEALLKYKENETESGISEYAIKLIIDDHCAYRDEHSGPFSFKTQSQRNLTALDKGKEAPPKLMHKSKSNVKTIEVFLDDDIPDFNRDRQRESTGNTLPITGLDFLDNW